MEGKEETKIFAKRSAHHDSRFHNLLSTAHIGHAEASELIVKKFSLVFPHGTFCVDNTYEREEREREIQKEKKHS